MRNVVRGPLFLLVFVLTGCATTPPLVTNPALGAVLRSLSSTAPANDVAIIEDAVRASPALRDQLDALAAAGKLESISVKPGDVAAISGEVKFGASFDANGMILSDGFLSQQSQMAYDVKIPNTILPNNTVFVLGHLAYHLRDAGFMQEAAHQAANEDAYMAIVLRNEAGAYIQGWNDVVDAATIQNGNRPLSPGETGALIINLLYRAAFIRAMNATGPHKLAFGSGGRIEATDENLAAISAALTDMPMPGFP